MLGWDEVLEGGLTPNSTIMSWRGIQGGIEAARQHHDVIMTPIQRLYFSNPRINKMTGFEWMNRVYNFEPVPAELTDAEKKFVNWLLKDVSGPNGQPIQRRWSGRFCPEWLLCPKYNGHCRSIRTLSVSWSAYPRC